MEENKKPSEEQIQQLKTSIIDVFDKLAGSIDLAKDIVYEKCRINAKHIAGITDIKVAVSDIDDITTEQYIEHTNTEIKNRIDSFQVTPDEIDKFKQACLSKIELPSFDEADYILYKKISELATTIIVAASMSLEVKNILFEILYLKNQQKLS